MIHPTAIPTVKPIYAYLTGPNMPPVAFTGEFVGNAPIMPHEDGVRKAYLTALGRWVPLRTEQGSSATVTMTEEDYLKCEAELAEMSADNPN